MYPKKRLLEKPDNCAKKRKRRSTYLLLGLGAPQNEVDLFMGNCFHVVSGLRLYIHIYIYTYHSKTKWEQTTPGLVSL